MARMTHDHDGDIAVFLIGMTFPRPWRVDLWLPVFMAMPKMLAELARNKGRAARGEEESLGFLGAHTLFSGRGPVVLQYWRSTEELYAYASSADHAHRPAWKAFNAKARKAGDAVGIWHETYRVPAGGHESIHVGMKPWGLAQATGTIPVARRGETARERISTSRAMP